MDVSKLIHNNNVVSRLLLKIICLIDGAELCNLKNIGHNVYFPHRLKGIILHENTVIEDNVTIFHQVTCGRGDMFNIDPRVSHTDYQGIYLKEGAVLCAGAKVICNRGTLTVGRNTIIAANAVLLQSTGDNEIWGGVPAKLIKKRDL